MSPVPSRLVDRWKHRWDPGDGRGTLYWHMLLGENPDVRDVARAAQGRLRHIPGLHMTPLDRLHVTTLLVGRTDDVAIERMADIVAVASQHLVLTPPITVALGRVLYHPEAVMLAMEPGSALAPVLAATQAATRRVLGHEGTINSGTVWVPHMTLCYSTADQSAQPVIAALGKHVHGCDVTIDRVSLVAQWGPERLWDWEPLGDARLQG